MSDTTQTQPIIPALTGVYENLSAFGEPLIRVTAGLLLMPHGAQKLFGLFGGGSNESLASRQTHGLEAGLDVLRQVETCSGDVVESKPQRGHLLVARPSIIGGAFFRRLSVQKS